MTYRRPHFSTGPTLPTPLQEDTTLFFHLNARKGGRLQCMICGNGLTPPACSYDFHGNAICPSHQVPLCGRCGRFLPVTDGPVRKFGAAFCCPACAGGVSGEQQREISERLVRFYNMKRIYIPPHRVVALDYDVINGDSDDSDGAVLGRAYNGSHPKYPGEYVIEMLRQQSPMGYLGTLAHEMMHIYLYNRRYNPPSDLCEGFCNLAKYIALCELEGRRTDTLYLLNTLMEDRDRRYGVTFRQLKTVYDLYGISSVIAIMKQFEQ